MTSFLTKCLCVPGQVLPYRNFLYSSGIKYYNIVRSFCHDEPIILLLQIID
jgi:hypothetical protein